MKITTEGQVIVALELFNKRCYNAGLYFKVDTINENYIYITFKQTMQNKQKCLEQKFWCDDLEFFSLLQKLPLKNENKINIFPSFHET